MNIIQPASLDLPRDQISYKGFLSIREGEATDIQHDEEGNIKAWNLNCERELPQKENKICWTGWQFVNSKGWSVSASIAIGNGLVSGADAPANSNTKLKTELDNGRFLCLGDGDSRVKSNTISLFSFWPKGQGYSGPVTEWGIFVTNQGFPIFNKDTGYLVSRIAYPFQKTNASKDVEILWVITAQS